MYRLIRLLFAIFFFSSVSAQQNSLVWKVSGNGLKKDSYLFGTIHLACKEDFKMNEKAKATLPKVEQLVFELDITKQENLIAMREYLKPDSAYFQNFDPAKRKVMDSILTAQNFPPMYLDALSPAGILSLLTLFSFACDDPTAVKGMETELLAQDDAKGKKIAELETVDFQFKLMNSIMGAEEIYQYVLTLDKQKEITKTMINAYFNEDLDALGSLFNDPSYMQEDKMADLLEKRNKAWMEKIPAMMEQQASLFAVGAGHLVGEKGIINLLKKKGYQVTPVFN